MCLKVHLIAEFDFYMFCILIQNWSWGTVYSLFTFPRAVRSTIVSRILLLICHCSTRMARGVYCGWSSRRLCGMALDMWHSGQMLANMRALEMPCNQWNLGLIWHERMVKTQSRFTPILFKYLRQPRTQTTFGHMDSTKPKKVNGQRGMSVSFRFCWRIMSSLHSMPRKGDRQTHTEIGIEI